jgi:type IV pilus assembly protein PilX
MMTFSRSLGHRSAAALRARERGVTLVIALIFMVALTLLGTGMIRATMSEERMSANSRDYDVAFAAAEAALRDAKIRITGAYSASATPMSNPAVIFPATGTCLNGLCAFDPSVTTTPVYLNTTYTFASSYASTLGYLTGTPAVTPQCNGCSTTTQPKYYIELTKKPPYGSTNPTDAFFYRVTAQGYGVRSTTVVTLEEGVPLP